MQAFDQPLVRNLKQNHGSSDYSLLYLTRVTSISAPGIESGTHSKNAQSENKQKLRAALKARKTGRRIHRSSTGPRSRKIAIVQLCPTTNEHASQRPTANRCGRARALVHALPPPKRNSLSQHARKRMGLCGPRNPKNLPVYPSSGHIRITQFFKRRR